ncbi:hypothetical protein L1D31_21650 [Vibrio sp. Isolate23]|uniref:hypothetical protein n=1 Tax=Vibrio sp. Isolate23 TaxID=2908533 RepID=UPI001EFE56B7|nr:hypothetical protein [Vibrio sp. Isolate23]MCG9685130.1 hypothetical protein [Vibrio sp. Isolate23]
MSLETEVQELTKASNEQTAASQALSQEVAGKMAEIDAAVAKLTGDVTTVINRSMYGSLVVSPDGSDTNEGTSESPLATIDKAVSLVPNGATRIIFLKSAANESPNNVYDINHWHDLESKNIVFSSSGGNNVTMRFLEDSGFTTRSGGSIRIGSAYHMNVEVVASRTKKELVRSYGGDCGFGGYYRVYIQNDSPNLMRLVSTHYHTGDYAAGISMCRVSAIKVDVSLSSQTDFHFIGMETAGLTVLLANSVTLSGNVALYSPDLKVQQVAAGDAYLITS